MLRALKTRLRAALPLPAEVFLVVAGLGCYLGTCWLARKPPSWPWALVPGLCLSLALEGWEIGDHHGISKLVGSSPGQLAAILGRHFKDVAWMNALPLAIFALAALRAER